MVGSQPGALHRQGLLDLDDQLPLLEHLGRTLGDLRARPEVILVGETDSGTGMGFDPDLMTERRQLGHRLWREADSVLVVLDFLGYADSHNHLQPLRANSLKSRKA